MVVYVVGQARVKDADGFKKYSETVAGLAEKFGGKLIAAGGSEDKVVIEGEQFAEGKVVIFQYPSIEAYQEYIASSQYQKGKEYRINSGSLDVCVVPSVD